MALALLSPEIINRSAKEYFDSTIFRRGEDYFQRGRVKNIDFEISEDDKTVLVTAKVRGSRSYESSVTVNAESGEILDATCTCPYDDACKHCAATALAFAEKTAITKVSGVDEVMVRTALKNMGISVEKMPADLLTRILDYQEETQKQPRLFAVPKKVWAPKKPVSPQPKKFFVKLSRHQNYAPSLYNEDNPYQLASINKALALPQISEEQRKLFTYIKENNFVRYDSPPPNFAELLTLIVNANIQVHTDNSYFDEEPVEIILKPTPLQASFRHEATPMYADKTKVRHDFYLVMPDKYWKTNQSWHSPFACDGTNIIYEKAGKLELHRLSPLLAKIIMRIIHQYDNIPAYRRDELKNPFAELTGAEVARYEELTADINKYLDLTTPLPPYEVHVEQNKPRPVFLTHYNNEAQTMRVAPGIDYGFYQQDISESIYFSYGKINYGFTRREPFEHPGTHIVDVKDNIIHVAEVDATKEISLAKECYGKSEQLCFTAKLRTTIKGSKPLENFLHDGWPKILAYANEKGYGIIFTQDSLPTEQATFRADFASQINADNDWLYFDLKCYCGDEKVTLEKLLEFLQSGRKYWKKDDGTLVNVANREELERLARLLESFHAKEDGFEGRLHHAAELEYVMTSSPHYNAVREESFNSFIRQLHRGKPVKKVRLSNKLNTVLRPYQKEGIEWLYFLRSFRFAGILADDMGLGKTLQTLAVIDREKIAGTPSLVICPKTLIYNWQAEAKKFFPALKTLVYDGTPPERAEKRKLITKNDLIITGYATIKRDFDEINEEKIRFNYAILDEAQFIKNHATKSAQVVKKIDAGYRLALTGTPLENSVSEIWSIYDFLMPGFLGNYKNFAENFHRPIMDHGDREALEHLRKKVEKFMLRRTKTEVLKELPPKIEQETQCHLSDAQNILYQQILSQVRSDIFNTVKTKGFQKAQIHILAGLTKLRQACNHPALLIKEKDFRKYESAKLELCMELVNEVVESKRKVLIFSQFTQMLDIISSSLDDANTPHLYLSGKTKDRQTLVDQFNGDPAFPVFLISLKAGGVGLNLTSADTVIIFDPWWNPSVENQAIDRTHRIGQTKTVNVYRLLTSGTIEEKIQALKKKKQHLFNAMVSQSGDTFKKLTWDDVKQLFE